jgi:hypothetical protein
VSSTVRSDAHSGTRRLRVPPPAWIAGGLLLIGSIVLTAWLMWPMPKDPADLFYGGTGDPFGAMASLREMAEENQPPFLPGSLPELSSPEGLDIAWIRGLASLPTTLTLYVLASLFGAVTAYNIFAFVAFPLTAMATFLLANRLSGNPWAAALGGWAFAFFPYAMTKGHGHYEFAHGWVAVLSVWRLLELTERPSVRNGVWAGLATVFAMAWTPYFILVVGVAFTTLLVFGFVSGWHRFGLRPVLAPFLAASGVVLVYLVGFYALSMQTDLGQGLRENNVDQLNAFSARAYEYVVPNASHPLVGGETGPWLQARIHGSNGSESTLYLGLTVLTLALIAFVGALRRRLAPETSRAVLGLTAMGIVAAWVSAPPEAVILGQTVPFPSKLVTEISSTWRVYARMVTVVMLAVALLASIGLAWIVRGRSTAVQAAVLVVVAFAVIRLDLWPAPAGVNPIAAQPIYKPLSELPPGVVAAYPLTGADSFGATFDQQWYDKPVLNGFEVGSTEEQRALQLEDLSDPGTPARLAGLGVSYVVVTLPTLRETVRQGPGLRRIAEDPSGVIYRVVPPAGRPAGAAFAQEGFGPGEPGPRGASYWLMQPTGVIEVHGTCGRCAGTVQLAIESFGQPRTVAIRDARGRSLYRGRITGRTRVRVPVRFSRVTELTVSTQPGPRPVAAVVPGSPDTRTLSVSVRIDAVRLQR